MFCEPMSRSISKTATVNNPKGLHLRPAGLLSQLAGQFQADLTLTKDGLTVDARSVLDMLTLVATQGSEIVVTGKGDDAEEAVVALTEFLESDVHDAEEG